MSEYKQPFLWNFITNFLCKNQTGAEEGLSKSANEEMNSSVTDFVSGAEESLTDSTNEEVNASITCFVSGAEETVARVSEDTDLKILSMFYDRKIVT